MSPSSSFSTQNTHYLHPPTSISLITHFQWVCQGSNLGPRSYQERALPLSHTPYLLILFPPSNYTLHLTFFQREYIVRLCMILSDIDIRKALKSKHIKITPKPNFESQLSSCSIDLRLSEKFYIFEYSRNILLDPHDKNLELPMRKIIIKKKERFIMHPGSFVIGSTVERIELPDDIGGRIEGRSSLGRLGIVIHSTAPLVHPGFRGQVTLELGNIGVMPVAIYPGMRICAMTFEMLSSPSSMPYYKKKDAKYRNQKGPTVSKITKDIT